MKKQDLISKTTSIIKNTEKVKLVLLFTIIALLFSIVFAPVVLLLFMTTGSSSSSAAELSCESFFQEESKTYPFESPVTGLYPTSSEQNTLIYSTMLKVKVKSISDGKIVFVGKKSIKIETKIENKNYLIEYQDLSYVKVKNNTEIKTGTVLGESKNFKLIITNKFKKNDIPEAKELIQTTTTDNNPAYDLCTNLLGKTNGTIENVPARFIKPLIEASKKCNIPVGILASQDAAESGWNEKAVSPVGAAGLTQFMPGTWEAYKVSTKDDPNPDIFNGESAIRAQGNYMCYLLSEVKKLQKDGTLDKNTDPIKLALAAYNAGLGNVIKYGGIPPFAETQGYVQRIYDNAGKYILRDKPNAKSSSEMARKALEYAKTQLGTMYVWGGKSPETGFDCSGLVTWAYIKAGYIGWSGASTYSIYPDLTKPGHIISKEEARPGDVVLSNFSSPGVPEHVALVSGENQVIEAPDIGLQIRIRDGFDADSEFRRV